LGFTFFFGLSNFFGGTKFKNVSIGVFMKKSFLSILFAFTFFSVFAVPGVKQFIPDASGEYVYYKDSTFKRESYIGILVYEVLPTGIRFCLLRSVHLQIMTIGCRQCIRGIKERSSHIIIHLQNALQHICYLFLAGLSVTCNGHLNL
jgi:hypothetical protein